MIAPVTNCYFFGRCARKRKKPERIPLDLETKPPYRRPKNRSLMEQNVKKQTARRSRRRTRSGVQRDRTPERGTRPTARPIRPPEQKTAPVTEPQQFFRESRERERLSAERQPADKRRSGSWYDQKSKHFRRRWRRIVRENKNGHFPESERFAVRLFLFLWGMGPMWGSLLRERLMQRHTKAVSKGGFLGALLGRIHPAVFLGTGFAAAVLLVFLSTYTMGITVLYDGELIGSVASEAAAETARTNLERTTAQTLGHTYTIEDSLLEYSSGLMRRDDLVDTKTFQEELSRKIGLVTSAYCLYVDGERIGATPYEGALEELQKQIKLSATNEGTISVSFAEDVEIKQEFVPTDELMNLGHLAETLYSTKTEEVIYTVAKGDTWSEIAEDHDLTSKQLLALNPGYNIDKLSIGEELILSASVPYLTMTVVQQERYVDTVPFDVEYTDSADLYKGDYKVISAGQYGAADVMANVTYVNGTETERILLSSVTLQEPVTEQRLQGTKERPTWLPTGNFRWPITGHITSRFGGRKSPGGIGTTNHKGLDIAAPRGTPVYASDGGTVTYAGWMGTYGYLVQIDHGNGYQTRYAHNSSIVVSVGQHVYKGQQIARVGSTGNSTGPHCHFEIRYNGVPKNPLNYL